jgi:uncharacterized membrane protein YbhN (UPF0104 family)
MIGAAGGVVPGPGGLGSTEAALVALLSVTGVQTASRAVRRPDLPRRHALGPVPIGLLSAGTLRRAKKTAKRP